MNKKHKTKKNMLKLKFKGVSSTDTDAIEAKYRLAGSMSSEEIKEFLQKHTENEEIGLNVEGDVYTFIIAPSSEITNSISRIENILEELMTEDRKRSVTVRECREAQTERRLVLWLFNRFINGDYDGFDKEE